MTPDATFPTIAVLGGGLSGAALAYHLALQQIAAHIVVVEPRPELGRGLAYSAQDPDHRLNVPATRMTLRTDTPDHFARWLIRPGAAALPDGSQTPTGDIYVPRVIFGNYVADQLAPLLAQGRIRHLPLAATAVLPGPAKYLIQLSDGSQLPADLIVLALTHPKPMVPLGLRGLLGNARFIDDPLSPGALQAVHPDEDVVIVGAGLTSADIIATLRRNGYRGKAVVLSRHGRRSMPHGPKQADSAADFAADPAHIALALLQNARAALKLDQAQGLTWHATLDKLRAQGPAIWAALPVAERRRFLRHLRGLWDVHRFRIAPQAADAVAQLLLDGRLTYHAAQILTAQAGPDGIALTFRPRHGTPQTLRIGRIILATGPDHANVIATTPVLASLAVLNLIRPDRTRLGIATAADGGALGVNNDPKTVFVAGPLARGTVGELMGVPEVIAWSEHVVRTLCAAIRATSGSDSQGHG